MSATDVGSVVWDIEPLLDGRSVDELLDEAAARAEALGAVKGTLATIEAPALAAALEEMAAITELVGRGIGYASLRFAADTADAANGALMQKASEKAAKVSTRLVWFSVEWAAVPDEQVDALLAADGMDHCRHYLEVVRSRRDYMLSEPEERIMTERDVTGRTAWSRLFGELTAAIRVDLDGQDMASEAP